MKTAHRARRARPPMVWLAPSACYSGNTVVAAAAGTLVTTIMLDPASGVGDPSSSIARLTVRAIWGNLTLTSNDAVNPCFWSAGIYVADNLTADAINNLNPAVAADVDGNRWLWLRHGYFPALTGVSIDASNHADGMYGTEVIVKSKRILESQAKLVLAVICSRASQFVPNLRVLVSRVA